MRIIATSGQILAVFPDAAKYGRVRSDDTNATPGRPLARRFGRDRAGAYQPFQEGCVPLQVS